LINHLAVQCVPGVAIVIIITSKEEFAGLGESNRGDATQNLVVAVLVDLTRGADIEEAAGGII